MLDYIILSYKIGFVLLIGLLLWLVGGLAGRLRGSSIIPGDFIARFGFWGVPVGVQVGLATHAPYFGLMGVILAGMGASLGYWGTFDLTIAANRTWSNALKLNAMGMVRFLPLFVAALTAEFSAVLPQDHHLALRILPAVLAGNSFFPAYLAGVWASKQFSPKLRVRGTYLLSAPSEWGEWFFWGTIFVALAGGLFLC